jgi:hypothetical protein
VKNFESAALALVTKRANDAIAIFQQRKNRVFHVNIDALMNAVILECANHFQPGAVANVRKSRVFVAAEISLQNPAIFRPIENRAPRFQFAHAIGRFLRVQFGHAPLVYILTAAHRVGEMNLPVIPVIDIGQGGRDSPFRHDRVRFAKKRFANESD